MDTPGERLDYYIKYKGFDNLKLFAEECDNVSYSSLVHITTGFRTMGMKVLNAIADYYPELNINWLLYNRGPMELQYENREGLDELSFQLIKLLKSKKSIRKKAIEILLKDDV